MGTGRSRYGAGRPGWRRKCEHLLGLDVRSLAREGLLRNGLSYGRSWSCGGEPSGSIGIRTIGGGIQLFYTLTEARS